MRIYKEKPGVISESSCWVCSHAGFLYIEDTLLKLLWSIVTEFKNDKHLVG